MSAKRCKGQKQRFSSRTTQLLKDSVLLLPMLTALVLLSCEQKGGTSSAGIGTPPRGYHQHVDPGYNNLKETLEQCGVKVNGIWLKAGGTSEGIIHGMQYVGRNFFYIDVSHIKTADMTVEVEKQRVIEVLTNRGKIKDLGVYPIDYLRIQFWNPPSYYTKKLY